MIKVTVWNEYNEKQKNDKNICKAYPDGMHNAIAAFLNSTGGIDAQTAIITEPEHGLSEERLKQTDVLIWWGHCFHDLVQDDVARRVAEHVNMGMGAIFLHSAHMAKPFKLLMGTSGSLQWREAEERERIWTVNPSHPIACGIPEQFLLEHEEMYGEPFDIPEPDSTVFIGWFQGGNVFRSGVTYERGRGKVFYFQPGHETHSGFHDANVQKILINAVRWAQPAARVDKLHCPNVAPLEKLD